MTQDVTLRWQPYKLLPYERTLGVREVHELLGSDGPLVSEEPLVVSLNGTPPEVLERATYFASAEWPEGRSLVPTQALLESSVNGETFKRQRTRYSAHGLHEYRGKFNPQVVRAIANLLGVGDESTVLDPFCGSGTTLLEGAHAGWSAVGLDLNPLAVEIANAKLAALRAAPMTLRKTVEALQQDLGELTTQLDFSAPWSEDVVRELLSGVGDTRLHNHEYLQKWFSAPVLAQIVLILDRIGTVVPPRLRPVLRVVLSDILREVSLQEPADLRMRRRKDPAPNYPVVATFLDASESRLEVVANAREVIGNPGFRQRAITGDARRPEALEGAKRWVGGRFDAVISSPPYLTALPYVDTQRLSLCLLGLSDPSGLSALDRQLIGSREVSATSSGDRREATRALPYSVKMLHDEMERRLAGGTDGFRRQNMPRLTARYFRDMMRTFRAAKAVVRRRGAMAFVVGPNRTRLGGEDVRIDTPMLLADTAEACGWTISELTELDTYQRFDLHHRNSIRSEYLLVVKNNGR